MQSKLVVVLAFFAASLNIFVSSCRDLTVNNGEPWYSDLGSRYNCAWYEQASRRCEDFGYFLFENFGLSAKEACCTCGGGLIRNPTTSPSPTTLSLHPTSSPTPGPTYWPTQVPTSSSPTSAPTYWSYSSSSKRNNAGYIVLILLGTVSGLFLVIGWLKKCKNSQNSNNNAPRSTNLRTRPTQPTQRTPQQTQPAASSIVDERDVRRQFILTNIIHKKVVTKSSQTNKIAITGTCHQDNTEIDEIDEGDVIFPHEAIIRERSERIASLRLSLMRLSLTHQVGDEEQAGAIIDKKDDICIETLRSIRSSMNINLDMESLDESLYSPRSCPICCEDYLKGDDVAWSKNEECCHAFHTDCIVPWLMDHDDCPMCRCVYVKEGAAGG